MKTLLLLLLVPLAIGLVVNGPVRNLLVQNAKDSAAQAYAERDAARDAYFIKACAQGKTGVVIFYKGVDCTAQ